MKIRNKKNIEIKENFKNNVKVCYRVRYYLSRLDSIVDSFKF